MNPRGLLVASFRAALAAADPAVIVPRNLPPPPKGRTIVVGAGKAAATMAHAVEEHWPGDKPLEGLVITRYGHGVRTKRIRVIEAGHPVPDDKGEAAAREILALARSLGPDDLMLALISGGGSSLLSLPAEGVPMADLKAVTKDLLASGAPIQDMNTVRKHLSAIAGGRLAAATKARVIALIISDVTGDQPTHIASGPCAPDPSTYRDALGILERFKVKPPRSIAQRLEKGARGEIDETPKPGDAAFARVENRLIATAHASLTAGAEHLRANGINAVVTDDAVTGEASEVGRKHAAAAVEARAHGRPARPPVALISGGETTVTVRGGGKGGRNTEYLLSLAIALDGLEDTWALSCGTDGIDGTEDNAGAIVTPDTLSRARSKGLDPEASLANNDAYTVFRALGDLVVTGPPRTNVNDYRVILVR